MDEDQNSRLARIEAILPTLATKAETCPGKCRRRKPWRNRLQLRNARLARRRSRPCRKKKARVERGLLV
jgi:hypothetical protein